MITLLLILFFVFAFLLIVVVILQSQREGHLDMFGATSTPFGVKTSSVLNKFTTIVGIIFFIIVFALSLSYNRIANIERKKVEEITKKDVKKTNVIEEGGALKIDALQKSKEENKTKEKQTNDETGLENNTQQQNDSNSTGQSDN